MQPGLGALTFLKVHQHFDFGANGLLVKPIASSQRPSKINRAYACQFLVNEMDEFPSGFSGRRFSPSCA